MYYRLRPYPYHRRYYNIDPYYYRRYYMFDSQIANIDQNMINFGDMTNVTQDANIYQLRSPETEKTNEPPEEDGALVPAT